MEDLRRRSAREVLDDHLNIANDWVEGALDEVLEEDLRRNVSEDIVILINRGTFHGYEGVRELAQLLSDELPKHEAVRIQLHCRRGKDGSSRVDVSGLNRPSA